MQTLSAVFEFLQFGSVDNLQISAMDLKGLAWIGNLYEKFEAMCLEVEEVMYQVNTLFCCLANYI